MGKKFYEKAKKIVLLSTLLIAILWLVDYNNVFRKIRIPLEFDGQPFTVYSFCESYSEGIRYIRIRGRVGDEDVREYLFDLKEEKILSFEGNEHLHSSFIDKRYAVSVFVDGQWKALNDATQSEELIEARDTNVDPCLLVSFSDRLKEHEDFQIDFSVLPDYKTTDRFTFFFSKAGHRTELYTAESAHLLDMRTHQFIEPPVDLKEGRRLELIADDSLAWYNNRQLWVIEMNTTLYLDYDEKYDNYGKHISGNGEYIYWGHNPVYACSTQTGKTQLIFDGEIVAQPTFDMNDIKFISENEVGAVGTKLREWYELGLFPGANNYFIMKYNFDTQKMKSIKLPLFAGATGNVFAWSYDKSEVYFVYAGKNDLYKMKI